MLIDINFQLMSMYAGMNINFFTSLFKQHLKMSMFKSWSTNILVKNMKIHVHIKKR